MEKLFEKLKEYLKMETEIPFEEFSEYYRNVINYLNSEYDALEQENLIKARYICSIIQANADGRAKQSRANAKAYKKISSKSVFWMDAINFRLIKEGMTQAEIDEATEKVNESIED